MPNINLLPWREERRQVRKQTFFYAAIIGGVVAAALVFIANLVFQGRIDQQRKRNGFLQTEIASLDKQIEEIKDLERLKERQLARMDIIEQLQRSRPEVVHLFDEIAKRIPDGVYLTAVKQTGRIVTIDGIAQSSTYVSAFMRNLDASDWFTDPRLSVVETVEQRSTGKGGRLGEPTRGSKFSVTIRQDSPYEETDENSAGDGGEVA